MKRGFTIIELLVVIAVLMTLAGAVGVGVSTAQKNARIAKATSTVRELTNAILAYENASKNHELPLIQSPKETSEATLRFLLGNSETGEGGNKKIQVLFNAEMRGGMLYDPWGQPYKVLIRQGSANVEDSVLKDISTTTFTPNLYRLTADDERANRPEEPKKK